MTEIPQMYDCRHNPKGVKENKMQRKTDRRTLYTRGAVKDALLELIRHTPYDRINVTAICKEAQISRATFYLHYDNVDDVLDHIIDDALMFSEQDSGGGLAEILEGSNEQLMPACQRIADSDRYHALFMDSLVSDRIIQRITQHERASVIPEIMKLGNVSEEDAEQLFRFMLHGSFAVNRSLGWNKDSRWYHVQDMLSRFISAGVREV